MTGIKPDSPGIGPNPHQRRRQEDDSSDSGVDEEKLEELVTDRVEEALGDEGQLSIRQGSNQRLPPQIEAEETPVGEPKSNLQIENLEQRITTVENQLGHMGSTAPQTGINADTADFIYRSFVATGAIFAVFVAALFAFIFGLPVIAVVILAVAVFLGYSAKEGLSSPNVA